MHITIFIITFFISLRMSLVLALTTSPPYFIVFGLLTGHNINSRANIKPIIETDSINIFIEELYAQSE